jgi:hypothetical protein
VAGVTVTVVTSPGGGWLEFADPPPQPTSKRALKKTREVPMVNRFTTTLGISFTLTKSTFVNGW